MCALSDANKASEIELNYENALSKRGIYEFPQQSIGNQGGT